MRIYVDLSEVTLVDHETARHLSGAHRPDVTYVNCPSYLRRWILSDPGGVQVDKRKQA